MERIPTKRLIYEFDRKFDRFNGQKKTNLRLEDKLNILNEAQMILFEKRVALAEINDEYRNSLRPFEEKENSLKIIGRKSKYIISAYPKGFYKLLRQRGIATKDCDTPKKELQILMFQSDKINAALKNPFWKPSYEWEHIIGDEGSEGFYSWHNNEFKIEEVIVDYYRRPDELHCASMAPNGQYEDWNGVLRKKDVNCEFSQNFDHRNLVDIGVLLARADQGDLRDLKTSIDALTSIENIKF